MNLRKDFDSVTDFIYSYGLLEYDRSLNPQDDEGNLKYELTDDGYNSFFNAVKSDAIIFENFNIEVNPETQAYRVFDPFHKHFSGYLYPDGWSNWSDRI